LLAYLAEIDRLGPQRPRLICIDHHLTALERIEELRAYCDVAMIEIGPGLSGATLVWKYFNGAFSQELDTPMLLRYVADQDIWEWKLEDSLEINSALNALDGHVESMIDELKLSMADEAAWRHDRFIEGRAILRMVDSQVVRSARSVRHVMVESTMLSIVNSSAFNSELGNYLCRHSHHRPNVLAVLYSIQEDWSVRCSVRSVDGSTVNARQFAERFGGGGHDNAAGCRFADFATFRETLDRLEREGWG
jgi:oligoribonuclease NrnB/cAMP/cGMP phosphodiesterase (DHH superfamily)